MRTEQQPLALFPTHGSDVALRADSTSTFGQNMTLPVHRWFRFPAGFSADWARKVISEFKPTLHGAVVLDPFAGVGTAVLAGEEAGVASCGLEAQPFIARIAKTKLMWNVSPEDFMELAQAVRSKALPQLPQFDVKTSFARICPGTGGYRPGRFVKVRPGRKPM